MSRLAKEGEPFASDAPVVKALGSVQAPFEKVEEGEAEEVDSSPQAYHAWMLLVADGLIWEVLEAGCPQS